MLFAKLVDLAHVRLQLFVIITQLSQHVERRNILSIIVENAL